MNWFRKPAPPAEPQPTPQDYLAMADTALRTARENYALACQAVAGWRVKHPEYTRIGEHVFRQILPSPELRELSRRESQAHEAMRKAMEHRAELLERYRPPETKYVAGVRVSP